LLQSACQPVSQDLSNKLCETVDKTDGSIILHMKSHFRVRQEHDEGGIEHSHISELSCPHTRNGRHDIRFDDRPTRHVEPAREAIGPGCLVRRQALDRLHTSSSEKGASSAAKSYEGTPKASRSIVVSLSI
jgi:hypothetical protein